KPNFVTCLAKPESLRPDFVRVLGRKGRSRCSRGVGDGSASEGHSSPLLESRASTTRRLRAPHDVRRVQSESDCDESQRAAADGCRPFYWTPGRQKKYSGGTGIHIASWRATMRSLLLTLAMFGLASCGDDITPINTPPDMSMNAVVDMRMPPPDL